MPFVKKLCAMFMLFVTAVSAVFSMYQLLPKYTVNAIEINSETPVLNFNTDPVLKEEATKNEESTNSTASEAIKASTNGKVLGKIQETVLSPYNAPISYNNVYLKNSTGVDISLKEELGKKIKAGEISEIVSLFETNPMFRGLMETSGASSNMFAFKQLMTSAGLPLSSEMSSMFGGKSAETVWDIAHGDFGATGGQLVQEQTQKRLVELATDNYVLTSIAIRALLVKIAQLILDEASIMGSGSGTTPMNTNQ